MRPKYMQPCQHEGCPLLQGLKGFSGLCVGHANRKYADSRLKKYKKYYVDAFKWPSGMCSVEIMAKSAKEALAIISKKALSQKVEVGNWYFHFHRAYLKPKHEVITL